MRGAKIIQPKKYFPKKEVCGIIWREVLKDKKAATNKHYCFVLGKKNICRYHFEKDKKRGSLYETASLQFLPKFLIIDFHFPPEFIYGFLATAFVDL
jgi:hypothetical protein